MSTEDEDTAKLEPALLAQKAKADDAEADKTPKAPAVAEAKPDATPPDATPPDATPPDAPKKEPAPEKFDPKAWALRNADHLIGGGIALVYVVWLLATARSLGFSRDEGFYFSAATDYERWFKVLFTTPSKAFERPIIDSIWTANHEHPSLMKSAFALSHYFFYEKWKLFTDQSTAFRFPGMLMMGLALYVTYLFAARRFSRRAGVVAALALGLMPNVFYHAHLACFDVPIMAMWIACIFAYWRAEKHPGLGAAVLAGVVYGLTLETKHNAWMLPGVFVPHAILIHWRTAAKETQETGRVGLPASLLMMATIGPALFLLLWPWLWNDTLPRLQEYVNFHVHHEYYNIEFLHRTYFGPPSPKAYMPVMLLATVPTVTVLLFLVGAGDRIVALARTWIGWVRKQAMPDDFDPVQTDALLLLGLAVPLAVFFLPTTPVFGGTKHWITAYPSLAIFAGRGFDMVATRIERLLRERTKLAEQQQRWALAVIGALTLLAPFAVTRHSHPFGLSAYVPFFGGTAGGADLGLNRQFWGFTTTSLDPWFREHTKPGDTVYIMDTAWPSWTRMVDEDRVPKWLRGVGSPAEATISIVHHEQHINEVDFNIWTEYGTTAPAYVLTHDGVPIISVYRRPPRRR
ncbi:MAG: glycosyltransferase family 39 protein [Labilithrix sp.]|nr:glycosyltransferase family 39 protein [Labilithrix sp.]MCW5809679.1 glycosyltransferase family 39 protein [Labilithrix sp.]